MLLRKKIAVIVTPTMRIIRRYALVASLLVLVSVDGFMSSPRPSFGFTLCVKKQQVKRNPSKVLDLDGPTNEDTAEDLETISPDDIPEMQYDENAHPIPHQPWRRGETNGCEDPIDAEWRRMAEKIIYSAAKSVGGEVRDVTWYLTQLVITLEENFENVEMYSTGPPIEVMDRTEGPKYLDPDDPNPEEIWLSDEPEFLWEEDTEREAQLKKNSYAPKDADEEDGDDDDDSEENAYPPIRVSRETREDMAGLSDDEEVDIENEPVPIDREVLPLDTRAVSTIARAILESLEESDEELQVLTRHYVVLSSPGAPDVLDTQRQFDARRGQDVVVETIDPWQSNRVLRGKLLERNSMDIIINKKGRMVTIPLNFVKVVRLPKGQ